MSDFVTRATHSATPIYGYVPTEWICALFLALFGLSTVIHTGQAIRYRMWWLLPTAATCGITELLGWTGRIWSSKNPTLLTPFLIQISTTGLAPTFFVAANFIILGQIIRHLGPQYSRIAPKLYTIIFCSIDLVALVVQGIGGGTASSADGDNVQAEKGGKIMLGGIAFQLAAIIIYVFLASEFFARWALNKPVRNVPVQDVKAAEAGVVRPSTHSNLSDSSATIEAEASSKAGDLLTEGLNHRAKIMIAGLAFSTVCILIRSIYRVIELSQGWDGRIITTQHYYNILDGAMIVLAMFSLNLIHPGHFLR